MAISDVPSERPTVSDRGGPDARGAGRPRRRERQRWARMLSRSANDLPVRSGMLQVIGKAT